MRPSVADTLCDFMTWPFECGQWLHMARQVFKTLTKFEDPMLIHSWVMSYDDLHRIALAMRLHHCECTISWHCDLCVDWQIFPTYLKSLARFVYLQLIWLYEINRVICQNSVWPWVKGYRAVCTCAKTHHRQQFGETITHLETPTPIYLFIIQVLWDYDERLHARISPLAGFRSKNCKFKIGPKNGGFRVKEMYILNVGFVTSKRHMLAQNRVLWRILCQNPGVLATGERKDSKNSNSVREIARARKRNILTAIEIEFCWVVGIPDIITYANVHDDRLRSLGYRGSSVAILRSFCRRSYNSVW